MESVFGKKFLSFCFVRVGFIVLIQTYLYRCNDGTVPQGGGGDLTILQSGGGDDDVFVRVKKYIASIGATGGAFQSVLFSNGEINSDVFKDGERKFTKLECEINRILQVDSTYFNNESDIIGNPEINKSRVYGISDFSASGDIPGELNVKKNENCYSQDWCSGFDKNHIIVVQAASQFNNLESVSSNLNSVIKWAGDTSQGPGVCSGSYVATKFREMAKFRDLLHDDFAYLNIDKKFYKNGYLELFNMSEEDKKGLFEKLCDTAKDKFKVLIQYCNFEKGDTNGYVVFNAAPSYQGKLSKSNKEGIDEYFNKNKYDNEICDLLVSIQYKILALFVRELVIKNPGKIIDVYLTEVGQGYFANPRSSYEKGIEEMKKVLNGVKNVVIWTTSGKLL